MEYERLRWAMKILANKKIKQFFIIGLLCMSIFLISSVSIVCLKTDYTEVYLIVLAFSMGILILMAGYWYFREQSKLLERAIVQIREYTDGHENVRIECDEEGELYLLFHSFYGGLHCGECFEVKINNTWVPVRIEMGDDWYLVGLPIAKLSGLTVRM